MAPIQIAPECYLRTMYMFRVVSGLTLVTAQEKVHKSSFPAMLCLWTMLIHCKTDFYSGYEQQIKKILILCKERKTRCTTYLLG